jgi:predicted permease
MVRSLRLSVRALALRPRFSVLVIAILALCIGGNTSIFSVAKAVLFEELPYQEADRLVVFNLVDIPSGIAVDPFSWIEAKEWALRADLLEGFSPFVHWRDRIVVESDAVERIGVNFVTPSYFELLGVRPQLGRLFSAQDSGAPNGAPILILSHDLWARHFACDPGIVGKKVQLNASIYTVVGVMPPHFYDFVQGTYKIEAWLPAVQAGQALSRGTALFDVRAARYWSGLARLKPGVTLAQARRQVDAIARQLQRERPDTNRDLGASLTPLRAFMFQDLHAGIRIMLAGAVFVLLIGCANLANLMLVRLTERQRELCLRLALGASRSSLIREVLLQCLLLSFAGGALGVLLAAWGTKVLVGLVQLPPFAGVQLDGGVLAVAVAATLLTGLIVALPPAISVARMDSQGTLQVIKSGGGKGAISTGSRNGLLVFQVAVAVVMLVAAGLLLHSFAELRAAGLDFNTDRLLTVRLAFATQRYLDPAAISHAEHEILRRFEGTSGVEGAAMWGPGMPGIDAGYYDVKPEAAGVADPPIVSNAHFISPGTLKMLGVPLLRGREFTIHDTLAAPRVAVIAEPLGNVLWPGQDPIGKRLMRAYRDKEAPWTIVGVIRNARFQGRLGEGHHHILFPQDQEPRPDTNLLVRTRLPVADMTATLRQVINQVDPQIPIFDAVSLRQRLHDEERSHRLSAVIVGAFSGVAVILAALGLYGVLAYAVAQRTREIGLRMALGAEPLTVVRMVMRWGLTVVGSGLILGLGGSLILARLMASLLYGVNLADPVTFSSVALLFTVVALLASYLPARRAAKVQPTIALRYD